MPPSSRGSQDLLQDTLGAISEAHASAAVAESRETTISEALKEAEDQHAHQLGEAYLVTRAKQRRLATEW